MITNERMHLTSKTLHFTGLYILKPFFLCPSPSLSDFFCYDADYLLIRPFGLLYSHLIVCWQENSVYSVKVSSSWTEEEKGGNTPYPHQPSPSSNIFLKSYPVQSTWLSPVVKSNFRNDSFLLLQVKYL